MVVIVQYMQMRYRSGVITGASAVAKPARTAVSHHIPGAITCGGSVAVLAANCKRERAKRERARRFTETLRYYSRKRSNKRQKSREVAINTLGHGNLR